MKHFENYFLDKKDFQNGWRICKYQKALRHYRTTKILEVVT